MRKIEVKSCGECLFRKGVSLEYCGVDANVWQTTLPKDKVHENCPLKKESVTVKLKEE